MTKPLNDLEKDLSEIVRALRRAAHEEERKETVSLTLDELKRLLEGHRSADVAAREPTR